MRNLFVLLATTSLLLFGTVSSAADGIMIPEKNAWARATPPGSKTTAIYLTLMNHSNSDISLTAVAADISDRVELHTHINQDGLMKMQQVNAITVPAGGHAELKPHGDHIMVFNLQEQLKAGSEVSVELTFDNGKTQTLRLPVLKQSPTAGHDSGDNSGHSSSHDSESHSSTKHEHKEDTKTDAKHMHDKTDS